MFETVSTENSDIEKYFSKLVQNKFAFYQGHKMKCFGHLIFAAIQEERISIQTIDFRI